MGSSRIGLAKWIVANGFGVGIVANGEPNRMGCEGESEGKREKTQKKREVKQKKKGAEGHISIKLLVRNSDSSLLDTFSDKLRFVTDNVLKYMILFLVTTSFCHYMLYSGTK